MQRQYCILFICLAVFHANKAQVSGDEVEDLENKNRFDPDVIPSRMYDYTTNTIAYKHKPTKKCYIQRMQKNNRLPLYISQSSSNEKEVEILAGTGIARFCSGLEVYKLLVPIRTKP